MNNCLNLNVIKVSQNIGSFYIASIKAKNLLEISYVDRMRLKDETSNKSSKIAEFSLLAISISPFYKLFFVFILNNYIIVISFLVVNVLLIDCHHFFLITHHMDFCLNLHFPLSK